MKTTTIDSFRQSLLPFSHPGNLTPAEASRLSLVLVETLSENVCDRFFLKFCSRLLTNDLYAEVVEERNINRFCGYPLCQQHQARINAATVSATQPGLLPYAYLSSFCSKRHYQCSEFYRTQLSDEAVFARANVTVEPYGSPAMKRYETDITLLEEVLDELDKRTTQNTQASIMDIVRQLDSMSIDGKQIQKEDVMESMGKMLEDIKIVEKTPADPVTAPMDELDERDDMPDEERYEYLQDQSRAIDGYVLRM